MSSPRKNEAVKHDLVEFQIQCLKVFCYHGNKSTILLFNLIFRTTPEVSTKLYFVEISLRDVMAFNRKGADFLASKFWIFFHFAASLTYIEFPDSSSNYVHYYQI